MSLLVPSRGMFWILFTAVVISTVPAAVFGATQAIRSYYSSQRVVALAEADQFVLQAAQGFMLERGVTVVGLLAPNRVPGPEADTRLNNIRSKAEVDGREVQRRLVLLGRADFAETIRTALRDIAATRLLTDAELHRPWEQRNHAHADVFREASAHLQAQFKPVQDWLDDAIRQSNPELGNSIAVKHMLLVARIKYGSSSYNMVSAAENPQAWSRSKLLIGRELSAAALTAWDLAVECAPIDPASRLQVAIATAKERYVSGPAAELRKKVTDSLEAGVPPSIDVDQFRAMESAGVQLIGAAAMAADQDMVRLSEQITASARRGAIWRAATVIGVLLVMGFALWTRRVLNAKTLEQAQSEVGERRAIQDGQLRLAAEQAATAHAAALVVGSIGAGLERLAAGDLTFRLTTPLPLSYEALRTNLNTAFSELEAMVARIIVGTGGIRLAIHDITQVADDLKVRTQRQTESLQQTTAAVQEVTTMIRNTENVALHATSVVAQTRAGAEQSDEMVHRAVTAMAEIEASSREIGQIVGVIDRIAAQTNLLALNAGVEAARAGTAGRGFGVVASEVKLLAARSAEAARQIKRLVASSTEQVSDGVRLVGQAGESFVRIIGQVGEISSAVTDIAVSAREQNAGLDKVNTALSRMDQIVEQNSQMIGQSTAASHELAEETQALFHLTGRFQIKAAP